MAEGEAKRKEKGLKGLTSKPALGRSFSGATNKFFRINNQSVLNYRFDEAHLKLKTHHRIYVKFCYLRCSKEMEEAVSQDENAIM